MSDDMDPEIAALIGISPQSPSPGEKARQSLMGSASLPPDFDSLFDGQSLEPQPGVPGEFSVDLNKKGFAAITKLEADPPGSWLNDPAYYKTVLNGENEEAQKLHDLLGKYVRSADPKDKGVYRQQIIPAYWYLAAKVALRAAASQAFSPKKLFIRFAALLPNLISPELADSLQRVVLEKNIDEPVYYIDEWVRAIATGNISASATDEVKSRGQSGDERAKFNTLTQRAQGRKDAAEGIMKRKAEDRLNLEAALREKINLICEHDGKSGLPQKLTPYSDHQRRAMSELSEITRRMLSADRELVQSMNEVEKAEAEISSISEKMGASGHEMRANMQTLAQEFEAVRQMTKLCVGRQGNHFPVLTREYFHGSLREIGTRENVVRLLAWVESIDCEAFCRPYKNTLHRIVPFVILIPCYGEQGICWEPFDRYNRASSRGRVAIPMYPKNLPMAIVTAVADLRWQVAKEKASYYWMEEGLTGNYYQWFSSKKMKGDVKEFFIQDYVIWLTKESEGIQKLDKEVRSIFWRYIPFAQAIKDKLKGRSYIYQELYQKDINRSLSDGY